MPTERPATPDLEDAYREHRLALLRLAYLLCGSHETSEDVVQTVFASAHERWGEIENPPAYLKRAVVNLVKDGQRRRFRRQAVRPVLDPVTVTLPPDVDETWHQLARLPRTQRAVLVLHYYEDLPLTEVAELLGRPAATVRSDHRRAPDHLRKELR